ncbi:hypothetical protein MY11210_001755 [Beauveria gryllotalpidicola]
MKLSLIVTVVSAALVSAKKKKTKTKTTRTLFTPTFLPKHFTKGWNGDDPSVLNCGQCKDVCAVAPVPKWLDEWYACIKWKCSWGGHCKPTDWGVFPETTATATSNSTSFATSKNATFNNAISATPSFITITSTTAPGPTSSLATISSTSSVTAAASTATSSSSKSRRSIRPSFITSMTLDE